MSVRSASRGSPAASSIRLALRTSSIVATRRASFVRWVLRWFARRRLSSAPKPSAISLMPSIMRFQEPPKAESLNHTSIPHVNNLPAELIDGKEPGMSGLMEYGDLEIESEVLGHTGAYTSDYKTGISNILVDSKASSS